MSRHQNAGQSLTIHFLDGKVKEDEIGGACSMLKRGEKCIEGHGRKSERKRLLGKTRRGWKDYF